MAAKIGYLDNGHPHLKIRVYGITADLAQEFEAMVDTGFSGFLALPIHQALPLALVWHGTSQFNLANGAKNTVMLAFGTVKVGDELVNGTIVIDSPESTPLLGMEFLRQCDNALIVSKNGVLFVDEAAVEQATTRVKDNTNLPPTASS